MYSLHVSFIQKYIRLNLFQSWFCLWLILISFFLLHDVWFSNAIIKYSAFADEVDKSKLSINPSPIRPLIINHNKVIKLPPIHPLSESGNFVTIKKPSYMIVKVKSGDSVSSLAKIFRVSTRDIIKLNNLKPPFLIIKGQKILIPIINLYKVIKGDSLSKISKQFSSKLSEIIKVNKLKPPYLLRAGQIIIIPNQNTNFDAQSKKPIAVNIKKIKKEIVTFIWPTKGRVISNYGSKKNGTSNEGITISAPSGTKVVSIADGTVAYAGDELSDYGNLILIRHRDGWMSTYAHSKKILVKRGDSVYKGQKIAEVGQTGNINFPQCHFELRHKGKAVNPISFLPKN